MQQLLLKRVLEQPARAHQVPDLLDKYEVPFTPLAHANWADSYPYKPKVKFRMAYADDQLLLHYVVSEDSVAAVAPDDGGRVWEDSCCEFFLQPFADGPYYNFECNAAEKMYIACGMSREGRKQVATYLYRSVKRWSSFGHKAFAERQSKHTWELALVIPLQVLTAHHLRHPRGMVMRANFYKCGDKLQNPHFLSWNPVDCDHPDFHRPSSFGKIVFL